MLLLVVLLLFFIPGGSSPSEHKNTGFGQSNGTCIKHHIFQWVIISKT